MGRSSDVEFDDITVVVNLLPDQLFFSLKCVDLNVKKVMLIVKFLLHVKVVSVDPLEVVLDSMLHLLELLCFAIEVQIHIRDMLSEHLLELAHACSPDSTRLVNLGDRKEVNLLWHLLQEFQLKRTLGYSLAQGCLRKFRFAIFLRCIFFCFFFNDR